MRLEVIVLLVLAVLSTMVQATRGTMAQVDRILMRSSASDLSRTYLWSTIVTQAAWGAYALSVSNIVISYLLLLGALCSLPIVAFTYYYPHDGGPNEKPDGASTPPGS